MYNFNAAKDPEEKGDPPCRCEHTLDKHVICQYYEENATIVPVTAGVLPVVLPSMQNSSPSHVHDRASSSSSASSSTMHTSVAAAKAMNANANTTGNVVPLANFSTSAFSDGQQRATSISPPPATIGASSKDFEFRQRGGEPLAQGDMHGQSN